jgi:nucleoside-diphosphate-sugar epimerase
VEQNGRESTVRAIACNSKYLEIKLLWENVKMKILITGIDGFLGTEICRRLRCSGWDVVGFSDGPMAGTAPQFYRGSVTDTRALADVFNQERPNACIHLAGLAHATISRDEMERIRQVNVTGALNTARAATEAGVSQFIFFSSVKVYGDKTSETGIDEDDAPQPEGVYAELKYQAELELAEMARKNGLGVVIVRPVAVFGPGDSRGNYARLIRAVRRGIFPIIGGGRARRSIVYLNRVAARIDHILGPGFIPGKTYVFCDGTFEFKEILLSMRRATGRAFFPNVPARLAGIGGNLADSILQRATGKEGHIKDALARLTDHFVIRTHRYKEDFGELEPFDLDQAMVETCAYQVGSKTRT